MNLIEIFVFGEPFFQIWLKFLLFHISNQIIKKFNKKIKIKETKLTTPKLYVYNVDLILDVLSKTLYMYFGLQRSLYLTSKTYPHACALLIEVAKLNSREWYFFSFRDRKYATGYRTNRATTSGYWKATGKDRTVHDSWTRAIVVMRKTLVFYQNRAPHGIKTGWIMHEFRLEDPHTPPKVCS